ncbi:hypothetical protein [Aestuariimicrobium ganziense]|uniref:hypothetical protein n=1 Tax=Aestuariimicrobium ganziense TaxID=2773677 RepID=UPI0019421FA5|nr:hypothetical protein [Aestuariimicrobium ganziense]
MRDALVALNLVRVPISLAMLAIGGTLVVAPGIVWMALSALATYFIGARLFRSMDASRYEGLVLIALLLAAITAAVTALA